MPLEVSVPASVAHVLDLHGFRAIEESYAVSNGSRRYENQHFAVQLFAERDGELYVKVNPLGRSAESYFLPGVIAFLHSNDELTREVRDIARGFDENYEGLVHVLGSQPSGEIERERLREWIAGFAQRDVERMRRASEKFKKEKAETRPWWKLW